VLAGVDLVTVKELMGHATITMTMRYSHPTPESKRAAVDIISRLAGRVGASTPAGLEENCNTSNLTGNCPGWVG
jgi:hypothetical protein